MKLYINGENKTIESIKTLHELLERFHLNPNSVVVERNKNVVARQELAECPVTEGDQIEIVQFVGGGADEVPIEEAAVPATPKPAAPKKPRKAKAKKESASGTSRVKGPANLVIVESPAKAKTINKFLGDDFLVEASMGHVRDLPKSKMGVDIAGDFTPSYIISKKARKTVTHLKNQAKGKTGIYLAPDPDREGEAISWHLEHIFKEANGKDVQIRRVVFNEITKEAVKEAFKHPREIAMNLVNAQQARRILDRIVGYELSPLLWRKVGRGLSAGRVQSVALRLIVDREREIKSFVPVEYWSIEAKLSSEKKENAEKVFIAKLEKIGKDKVEIKNREDAEKIRQDILNHPFKVSKVDKSERRRKPQAPYTTSKIQQEAYNRLGFPAAKTMRVAQKLYEGVEIGDEGSTGLITYMRTDSVNIAKSAQDEVVQFIRQKFGADYLPKEPPVYKAKKGAQEAHEAIRPTSVRREPQALRQYLADDEFKLYELIWQKFVASQMSAAVDEHMSVVIDVKEKYFFKTTGRINLFPGFSIVFSEAKAQKEKKEEKEKQEGEEDEPIYELPQLTVGEILKLHELMGYQHFTKPPARYNDASLVKTLEEKGIGRPSTYAPTIYTILVREYVNRKGGALIPTELGETVVDLLVKHFPKVMEIEFTAVMEEELDKIEEGEMEWVAVLKDFYGPFETDLTQARKEMQNMRQEVVTTEYKCDICGKNMVIKWGRFGKFLACPGFPECKYTRSIPLGVFCPEPGCGGELVKRLSKKRRTFYGCSNYPKCTYIANKLPTKGEAISEDEQISETDRETLGP
ncbi:MAG: type I DNA topoisomerase [Candidatus Omnitrophica bacterium]|nr:type I DNA topoisomerase [Candidatus Omnitrophota bacterium]